MHRWWGLPKKKYKPKHVAGKHAKGFRFTWRKGKHSYKPKHDVKEWKTDEKTGRKIPPPTKV